MHAAVERSGVFITGNFRSSAFPFRDQGGFRGEGDCASLRFGDSFRLPLNHGFPILELFPIELFFPLDGRRGALGAMMAILMASSAAIGLDVVEELALGVVGDLAPFDRRGRVGSFQSRRKARLFFVSDYGKIFKNLRSNCPFNMILYSLKALSGLYKRVIPSRLF
jgi:hypothetical protein